MTTSQFGQVSCARGMNPNSRCWLGFQIRWSPGDRHFHKGAMLQSACGRRNTTKLEGKRRWEAYQTFFPIFLIWGITGPVSKTYVTGACPAEPYACPQACPNPLMVRKCTSDTPIRSFIAQNGNVTHAHRCPTHLLRPAVRDNANSVEETGSVSRAFRLRQLAPRNIASLSA